jgi:hypothetical protein
MRFSLSRCIMFAAVLGFFALAARPALAQSTVGHFSSSGGTAEVAAETVDPTTGYVNYVDIFVGQTTSHQPGGPPITTVTASAFFEIFDPSTFTLIDYGFGDLTVNASSLPTGASKLDSASFSVSGDLTGFLTGNTYPVSADVSFTGSGAPITETVHEKFKVPGGFTENFKFSGTFRGADVSGTVSFNGLTLDTIDFAQISYSKQFDVVISK